MLWHGGASYGSGYVADDTEEFDSLKDAISSFDARADGSNMYYPGVERTPEEEGGQSAWIFLYDPNDEANGPGDPYPDRILDYGPRGGVRMTLA